MVVARSTLNARNMVVTCVDLTRILFLFCIVASILTDLPSGWQQQEPCALARQCVDTIVKNVVRGAEYRHAHVGRGQCVARTRRRNHLHDAVSATFAKKRPYCRNVL